MVFVRSSSTSLTPIKYRCLIKKFDQITLTSLSALLVRTDCWIFQNFGLYILVQKVFELSNVPKRPTFGYSILVESHALLTRMRNQ